MKFRFEEDSGTVILISSDNSDWDRIAVLMQQVDVGHLRLFTVACAEPENGFTMDFLFRPTQSRSEGVTFEVVAGDSDDVEAMRRFRDAYVNIQSRYSGMRAVPGEFGLALHISFMG